MLPFGKGLVFGFLLAAMVGPMWLLCLRRTIDAGPLAGFVAGMGIAVADAIYGAIAAFGLTAVSSFLLGHKFWLALGGGLFMLWLGCRAMLAKPPRLDPGNRNPATAGRLASAFLGTLGLTLANPPTILAFAAIFAGLGIGAGSDYVAAGLIVCGVFLGSALWWLILAAGAAQLRRRIGPTLLRGINVVSGLTILAFGLWQLAQLF